MLKQKCRLNFRMTRWPDDLTKWLDDDQMMTTDQRTTWQDNSMTGWQDDRMTGWQEWPEWPNGPNLTQMTHKTLITLNDPNYLNDPNNPNDPNNLNEPNNPNVQNDPNDWLDNRKLRRRLTVWYFWSINWFASTQSICFHSDVASSTG